ncbi:MAG: tripartite tricarboxylate transporter TctB family protein [Thermodesulfobacteriota bacterium]
MSIDRVSGLALLGISIFVAVESRVLPFGTHSRPGPAYLPFILALFLGAMSLILIFYPKKDSLSIKQLRWTEGKHALAILACCFFGTFAIDQLGYRITMIIILGFLLAVLERMKIWWALLWTLGLALGSFWVFDSLLKVPLPRGGLGI